jgi:hypothetical protein
MEAMVKRMMVVWLVVVDIEFGEWKKIYLNERHRVGMLSQTQRMESSKWVALLEWVGLG